jgi:hypothetical protein
MEKTEMMKRYEGETGKQSAIVKFMTGGQALDQKSYPKLGPFDYNTEYIAWLETKAEAYDRLMSGGKKTLKEIANFLQRPVAVDREGRLLWFPKKPEIGLLAWIWYDEQFGCFGEELPKYLIDYTGDWKDSLTLPDVWEEKK